MIAPLNLVIACLVAAAAVSSAEPIDVNSDYSIDPSDRVCHPYCGDERDQGFLFKSFVVILKFLKSFKMQIFPF